MSDKPSLKDAAKLLKWLTDVRAGSTCPYTIEESRRIASWLEAQSEREGKIQTAIEKFGEFADEVETVARGFQPDAMSHSEAALDSYTGKTQALFIVASNMKLAIDDLLTDAKAGERSE